MTRVGYSALKLFEKLHARKIVLTSDTFITSKLIGASWITWVSGLTLEPPFMMQYSHWFDLSLAISYRSLER